MLEFIAKNMYIVVIMAIFFLFLYMMGGDDIIFFRRKKYLMDPKAQEKLMSGLGKFARVRGFTVMGPTTIKFEDKEMSFDAILLGFFGALGVKVCPQGGDIYGDVNSDTWVQIYEDNRITFDSPVNQMLGSTKLFKDIFRREKIKGGNCDSMAVFTNKDANVAVARSLPACHVSNLSATLETPKYLTDNGADIEGMKAAIEKYSV